MQAWLDERFLANVRIRAAGVGCAGLFIALGFGWPVPEPTRPSSWSASDKTDCLIERLRSTDTQGVNFGPYQEGAGIIRKLDSCEEARPRSELLSFRMERSAMTWMELVSTLTGGRAITAVGRSLYLQMEILNFE
jgi:hypothetical protein